MSGSLGSQIMSFIYPMGGQSKLGVLSLDVLVSENLKLPSDVTKYPVEDGSEDISDHITQNNEEISITASISASKLLSFEFGSDCKTRLIDAVTQLRSMHKDRKPVKVVTGLGQYKDMAFTSMSITRSNSKNGGHWLDINADLRHIKKVSLKQAQLPPDKAADGTKGKAGDTEKHAGPSGNSKTEPSKDTMFNTKKFATEHLGYTPPTTPPLFGAGGVINR